MLTHLVSILLLIQGFLFQFGHGFTCQGDTYTIALNSCPDYGGQRLSSGGNVSVLVKTVKNLPDRDVYLGSYVSDPYVKFTVGENHQVSSRYVNNDLSPFWNDTVSLGVLGSATEILVTIMDKDIGIEFFDDVLIQKKMRVPFCTTFTAQYTEYFCDTPFNCKVDDSLWQMPVRKVCHEVGKLQMNGLECDEPGAICLELEFFIVPFQMEVELVNDLVVKQTPHLSVAGEFDDRAPWTTTNRFGFPYLGINSDYFDFRTSAYDKLEGGLLLQTDVADKAAGAENEIRFYASTNLPATIYICRNDEDNEVGVPSWITDEYESRNLSVTRLIYFDQDVTFGCFYQEVPGTKKNRWGGIMSGYLTFRTNTIAGLEDGVLANYQDNYFIIALPRVIVPQDINLDIYYSSGPFITRLFAHGIIFAWFTFVIAHFMRRIGFRLDRIMTYLSTRVYTGELKHVVATLFVASYGQSPSNIEYRAHLFHAQNAIYLILAIPHFLLLSWGVCCVATVEPQAVGYGIIFIGSASLFLWAGFRLWEVRQWTISPLSLIQVMASVILFICFIISVIFADPAVVKYHFAIDLPALSLAFGTINTFPLLLLTFQRDKAYKTNMGIVVEKLTETVQKIKSGKGENMKKPNKQISVNKVLHALLGNSYTLNPNVPLFKYGTVLLDINSNLKSLDDKKRFGNVLYNISLFILFVYLMIGVTRTDYPSLVFLHCLALLLLDSMHTSLTHGDVEWTAGYHIFLLVAGRLLIMSSSSNYWIMNYSVAYMVYSIALSQELLNTFLPYITKEQAGDIAFAGKESKSEVHPDIAGAPAFCFGFLTFAFVAILLVAGFGKLDALPIGIVNVWGSYWPTYVFGLIAFLAIITGVLIVATGRAFYLSKHGLLRGYARECYMFKPKYRLPLILALFSEVSIISSGILIYGATGASAILTLAIFLPPIVVCMSYSYKVWLENDYELIIWPPIEKPPENKDDAPTELEVAYHMMDNLFGSETRTTNEGDMTVEDFPETEDKSAEKQARTLKDFKLPALDAAPSENKPIKMPALPLKSALRKKRAAMGIQTVGAPLVDDLKAREGANADQFGGGDVIDSNDPWAQFEDNIEDEEDELKSKQLIGKSKKPNDGQRRGIMEHPYIVGAKTWILNTTAGKWIADQIGQCIKYIKDRSRAYRKVEPSESEEEEGENGEKINKADVVATKPVPKVAEMHFWDAAYQGFLTRQEYLILLSWFGGLFLIMLMGIVLSKTVTPEYMGHLVWVSAWMLICTVVPIVKYFHTYVVDETIKLFAGFVALLHFLFCVSFFGAALDSDNGSPGSLTILDFFFYYPVFVYMLVEAYKWKDDGWVLIPLDKDGDGSVTWKEYVAFFKLYPLIGAMMILLVFQCYVWIGTITGNVALLCLLLGSIGYVFARDWALNDFYLSNDLTFIGDMILQFIMFITFLVAIFYPSNPIFPVSVFFFTLVFRCCSKIIARLLVADPDLVIYMSPFVFPIYSYNSRKGDVVDESDFGKQIMYALLAGALWGAFMAIFIYPVSIGIAIACIFLLVIAALLSAAVSYVPLQLGRLALMMSPDTMMGAVNQALETFEERKKPLQLEIPDWEDDNIENIERSLIERTKSKKNMKDQTAILLAAELIDDSRALTHVHVDSRARMVNLTEEEDRDEMPWYKRYWKDFLDAYEAAKKALLPPDKMKDYKRHSEAMFSFSDVLAEAILTGRGPYGFMGLEGLWFKLFKMAQTNPNLKFLNQPWLNVYDEYGNNSTTVQLSEPLDSATILRRLGEMDPQLDKTVHEELRCSIHFLLMVVVSADAKLQREKILFQKFLRENRFRLASNGISPPSDIFISSSYASIDIALVAVWLSTLTAEERERFHMLKQTFSEEQVIRDEAIDNEDYMNSYNASNLVKDREFREIEMFQKLSREITVRQNERVRALVDHLTIQEKSVFMMHKQEWLTNADCYVKPEDAELYEKFKTAVIHCEDEATEFARQVLEDIEAARKDCRIGEYGRNYQFVDSEFNPGDHSVGDCAARSSIVGWRCAPGICSTVQLFETGTDPDDVEVGVFKTNWLLSALSMLAAAGGIGDGGVDEQILNLFVGHLAIDGQISYTTEVGAYCVRLYKRGVWTPVIVDDLFPMLKEDLWTNENKGMAGGHSKECGEIWVSLVEKAFAKYYGSYSSIERGFVHHALQDLTGCEAECLYLNEVSKGSQKRVLWDMLLRYKKNGYILGAGTGSSSLADKGILEMGIVFDAAYTVYDVRQVDGHRLIKLRNPPGDHDEWKGDWSDKSPLWTRRLKKKLGWTDNDDNTFWMSFDDFCNVFRNLFICKWYDKHKWIEQYLSGEWMKVDPQADIPVSLKAKQKKYDFDGVEIEDDDEEDDKPTGASQVDTSGGLPSKHNPGCILENNPFYVLRIHRPTDIRLTLSQTDSRGVAHHDPHPAAMFICKSPHPKAALRLKTINRDDVLAYSGEAKTERVQHLYTSLKPGVYVVLVATYVSGLTGNFTLSVLSNYKCKLSPLWPPAWLKDGQSVNPNALLDGPDQTQTENKYIAKMVTTFKKGINLLAGSGNGGEDNDEEAEKAGGDDENAVDKVDKEEDDYDSPV